MFAATTLPLLQCSCWQHAACWNKGRSKEQADMNWYGFKFLRWLLKNAAWRRGSPAKEDMMAKLIEFYVPANFQSPKKQWTPEELRGKIINFHAGTTRKSA
jgi:hypothetical protein